MKALMTEEISAQFLAVSSLEDKPLTYSPDLWTRNKHPLVALTDVREASEFSESSGRNECGGWTAELNSLQCEGYQYP
jgi:hypothetical protein